MERDFVRGNLNMLILTLLQQEPLYGLQIAKQLGALIDDTDAQPLSYGSVYPALHRLEKHRFIEGNDAPSEAGARPIRQYHLTLAGAAELARLQAAQHDFIQQLKVLWGES